MCQSKEKWIGKEGKHLFVFKKVLFISLHLKHVLTNYEYCKKT